MNQAKEQFMFDLQLFNDGEPAPAAVPESVPRDAPATTPPAEVQNPPAATAEDSSVDYSQLGKAKHPEDQLAFLREHGFIDGKSPEQPKTDPQVKPDEASQQAGQTTEQPPVTDPEVEIKVNGEIKKIKQSELIELAQKGADYTRKTQELAEQRRQLALQQHPVPQAPPNAENQAGKAAQEYQAAVSQAERNLGVEPGGFNQFDPVHQFELQKVALQHSSEQASRQQVGNRINSFVQQAQFDPLSQQVDANFDTYLFKMGAEGADGAAKANAIMASKQRFLTGHATMADLDALESHWNYVKTALSAPATPPKPTPVPVVKPAAEPPKTEAPGNGLAPTKERINYKNLGHLKQSDQIAALRKAGYLKRG